MAVFECEDANGNTPLSEASGGGNVDAIKFLVEKGRPLYNIVEIVSNCLIVMQAQM